MPEYKNTAGKKKPQKQNKILNFFRLAIFWVIVLFLGSAIFTSLTGDGYGICAAGDFSFSCHDFTLANLTTARHRNELRTTEEKYLYIDHRHRGIGSLSCGPEPEAAYELKPEPFDFTFTLAPDWGNEGGFDLMKRY